MNRSGSALSFMEPATTRVWAEMLSDRKFFNRVMSQPDHAAV